MDPSTSQCLLSCDSGFYASQEKVTSNDEKFSDSLIVTARSVCRPCPQFCKTCSKSKPQSCIECISGSKFRKYDSTCIPDSANDSTSVFYNLCISLAVILCAVLIVCLILCYVIRPKCRPKTKILPYVAYQHIPKPNDRFSLSSLSDDVDSDDVTFSDPLLKNENTKREAYGVIKS